MPRYLVLHLDSPLIAFGGESIDNYGVIRDFPALSMITGLIANALGWDRKDGPLHDRLQQRLVIGCVLMQGSQKIQDYQTAQIAKADSGWTTRGYAEGRGGNSYDGSHLRFRDYHANLRSWVVVSLKSPDESPTLDEIGAALDKPVRPLFIGRKPCLPVGRLVAGWQDATDVRSALQCVIDSGDAHTVPAWRAQWPDGEGRGPSDRVMDICDERNWVSGVHGGWRRVREGVLHRQEQKQDQENTA